MSQYSSHNFDFLGQIFLLLKKSIDNAREETEALKNLEKNAKEIGGSENLSMDQLSSFAEEKNRKASEARIKFAAKKNEAEEFYSSLRILKARLLTHSWRGGLPFQHALREMKQIEEYSWTAETEAGARAVATKSTRHAAAQPPNGSNQASSSRSSQTSQSFDQERTPAATAVVAVSSRETQTTPHLNELVKLTFIALHSNDCQPLERLFQNSSYIHASVGLKLEIMKLLGTEGSSNRP
jgi:hypothetical protein